MSKDNANFRLFGSPVNLSYRSKKKEDRRNRSRPRSALQNSITPDNQEKFKRPFSADTKDRAPSTRSFLKSFSAELLQSYNNSPTSIRILPPTEKLLNNSYNTINQVPKSSKDLCSNASDYGSEDTFISLGTKIKAKAQSGPKNKLANTKNNLKYKNIAKKSRRGMDDPMNEKESRDYGLEIRITERPSRTPSPTRNRVLFDQRNTSPTFKNRSCESYYIPFEESGETGANLTGRVSFGSKNRQSEVEQTLEDYTRRLASTKQQLSLVEEESTQDLDSIPSQNMISLTPENSLADTKNLKDRAASNKVENVENIDQKPESFFRAARNYDNFYSEFQASSSSVYPPKMSSTLIPTDTSSKDSGYTESGMKVEKSIMQNYSLPSTAYLVKSESHDKFHDQPKSLDSASSKSNDKNYNKQSDNLVEPLNHSRLLYKDFFLKKDDKPVPPQNTPVKSDIQITSISDITNTNNRELEDVDFQYPSYLVNSSTKAYTSKVIEDYKKELRAIDSLHELTIKDIKTDAISPTPFNIDKMFEQHSSVLKQDGSDNSEESKNTSDEIFFNDKNILETHTKQDISKVTTKELIQNYLKIKSDYAKENTNKNLKKKDTTLMKPVSKSDENSKYKQDWNNHAIKSATSKNDMPVNIRNQTQAQKSAFTMRAPLSARIEGVQNDKDIDSWMSLSTPSPSTLDLDKIESFIEGNSEPTTKSDTKIKENDEILTEIKPNSTPKPNYTIIPPVPIDETKPTELNSKSTVLDIYSMLKEIESYGDTPVASVSNINANNTSKPKEDEERNSSPKDNFMEIFEFLEKVEQSANDALSVVTSTTPHAIPKLEALLRLPQTELAQRLVTASLQLEERSCCIALLQESLTNHKEQMISKISNLERQSNRSVAKVKQECEETIKRHQNFIDQLINDKKTLNHRIEQLVDERRALEERWKRAATSLEERYKLELRNQHDKMAAAQQVARQRWVRQKAEKIKELTVKGLEGELREMADRQQKEVSDLKMLHAEQIGRATAKHANELEELRRTLEEEKETALVKERQLASTRMEKQILELELTYQEQRTRLVGDMRAENERVAAELSGKERTLREELDKWKEEQEKLLEEKRLQMQEEISQQKDKLEEQMKQKRQQMEEEFEQYKKDYEAEQQLILKKKVTEIAAQHKQERDKEIERAIESMEAEAQAGRRELQDALRRNKEQYETELRELGETERATLKRYQEAQARVRQTEDRCAELEVTISQLETRNRILTEKNTQLESRAEEARASCEEAWRCKVDSLNKEMEDMKRTHEEQMHQLYAKVKVAVARKDSAIQALTREAGKYQEKITMLEQRLQQQRKDFLKHK